MSKKAQKPEGAEEWTMSVPEAGWKYFKAKRKRAYDLAKLGIIPTMRTGPNSIRALTKVLERMLAGEK